ARARSRCTSRRRHGGWRATPAVPVPAGSRDGHGSALAATRTSAIHARVAELEALVDERELGKDLTRRDMSDQRPVCVRARAQPQPLHDVAVELDDAGRLAAGALDH